MKVTRRFQPLLGRRSLAGTSLMALAVLCLVLASSGCEEEEQGPDIRWWTMRPHADRGACTGCHTRTDGGGRPLPRITSTARMPHEDRGVCSNCHRIGVGLAGVARAPAQRRLENRAEQRVRGWVRPAAATAPAAVQTSF